MKKFMNLNKETAMRLWVQQFGKKQKAIDYSGRQIAKAAYNDRNSNYGWNVDHILPQSRGGKTADHNLICCHILTNDEKADRFPCFKANEKDFEIQRRQNHYEIVGKSSIQKTQENETVNFLDVAQGLKCWKQCGSDGKKIFAGYVKIRVELSNESNQLLNRYENFLMELFDVENIFVDKCNVGLINTYYNRCFIFTVIVSDIPAKEDTQNLLDDCITLNTYSTYFTNHTDFKNIQIVCGMKSYDSHFEMSLNCQKDMLEKQVPFQDSLAIDELIVINTDAKKDWRDIPVRQGQDIFYPYNYVFTKLEKNLENRSEI